MLCAVGALGQMMLGKSQARDALRMISGLLMLHMTCESAQTLLIRLGECQGLTELFECLMK